MKLPLWSIVQQKFVLKQVPEPENSYGNFPRKNNFKPQKGTYRDVICGNYFASSN
ncbi:hypothetical protein LEP1GSC161_1894 [Leptospira santarosai str. CBC1416]|uniref:Uncharacterized protein n=1 Tax=Leptospira santarosai str. CBC1416 TaxID=1193059 RepID=M6VIU6_9LEPT|nr:hypothetical protein LEP1GSC071_1990 [Leptospira santarosai str. JET]EMO57437.1 hypothetical protein LEP1GSC161_1894 [Leptospira santarosai str. CBC1416]EMO83271.1 hypothetical protein LEP1GSC070_2564 [Leptospira santarosai str. AIM]